MARLLHTIYLFLQLLVKPLVSSLYAVSRFYLPIPYVRIGSIEHANIIRCRLNLLRIKYYGFLTKVAIVINCIITIIFYLIPKGNIPSRFLV